MAFSILYPEDPHKNAEQDSLSIRPFGTFNSTTSRPREATAIVAASKAFAIGKDGDIPWRLPEDMAHFKATTMGHPVIMGRKTWESLPKRPLPGRLNIVVSRNPEYLAEGAETALTPQAALDLCPAGEIPFFIGGGEIYRQALPFCNKVIITEVDVNIEDADTFFPALNSKEWKITDKSEEMVSKNGTHYLFITYNRI